MEPQTRGSSADVYAGRVIRTLNDGFVTLMTSLGHRTGLFDVMAALPPSTSTRIAEAAGLDERYVREWLAAMTSARVVEYDPKTGSYYLPVEYAAVLTRAAGPNNLAAHAQFLPLLASVEDLVVACFRGGGGVEYEAFTRFQEVMADIRASGLDDTIVGAMLDLAPGLREQLEEGADVLDVGCGRGRVMNMLARMFPNSSFRGYDLSPEAIAAAREEADEWGLKNVDFEVADVAALDEPAAYDLITAFDAIHDQAFPRVVLRNIAEALRDGGTFLMQDIAASSHLERNAAHPFAPMLYSISAMHCMTVSLARNGEGLGTMWGEETARHMLYGAGFRKLRFERLEGDAFNYYCVARK